MLASEINFTEIINEGYDRIVEIGAKLISRRKSKRDVSDLCAHINNIMEGIGYLESEHVLESDKLIIAQLLVEIGPLRSNVSGVYQGDASELSETTK